jgi:hypothetical protein
MTEQETINQTESQEASQETQQEAPVIPTEPQIDYRAQYNEMVRRLLAQEQELEAIKQNVTQRRAEPDPDITDEDIQQRPATAIKEIIQRELRSALGEVQEISQSFKRDKQIAEAEEKVFSAYPHLQPYREALSTTVRQALSSARTVDPGTYATTLAAVVGNYAIQSLIAQPPAQTPAPQPPPRGAVPTPSTSNTKQLSPIEIKAMRRAGFDPNKKEDVQRFFDIVNNDGGIEL